MVDTDDTRRTIHDGRRTTPRVWHKLPTGELKIINVSPQLTGNWICFIDRNAADYPAESGKFCIQACVLF